MSKKLIISVTKKDIDITYFSGKGSGGQNRNRHKNCVRMIHRDSGAKSTGQDQKDIRANTKNAFLRLINSEKFENWHRLEVAKKMRDSSEIDRQVKKSMKDSLIKYEVRDNKGKWIEVDPELIAEASE